MVLWWQLSAISTIFFPWYFIQSYLKSSKLCKSLFSSNLTIRCLSLKVLNIDAFKGVSCQYMCWYLNKASFQILDLSCCYPDLFCLINRAEIIAYFLFLSISEKSCMHACMHVSVIIISYTLLYIFPFIRSKQQVS